MGWSSVVLASGQFMHHAMNVQTGHVSSNTEIELSATQFPCHSLNQIDHQNDHHDLEHGQNAYTSHAYHTHDSPCLLNNKKDSSPHGHDLIVTQSHGQQHHDTSDKHVQCNECATSHCQTSNSLYVFDDHLDISMPYLEYVVVQNYSIYQAQHLRGFWQEILRPPKA